MRSYLYLESADRSAALALLRQLRALPGLGTLSNLRLIDCLAIDAAYPAQTLAPLLCGLGGTITLELPLTDDTRCIPRKAGPDTDTAMLLRAAGIDAAVTRQPIALLRGLDDWQYRHVRDALAAAAETETIPPRSLPDDAFIGFTRTPLNELCAQAERLGLALPEGCMSVIADHYRAEGRDPWPDELLILDEAFRQALADPAVCAPVEFVTNDARLHAVYADLMAKRRALTPDADAPATLGELSTIATRYLCGHSGTPAPAARLADSAYALAASGGTACGGFADLVDEVSLLMAASPCKTAPIAVEDRLLLVLPATPEDVPAFPQALERFFAAPNVAESVHRSLPVAPGRLIGTLGRMLGDSGLGLRLTPPADGTSLMAHLTPTLPGALLACAAGAGKLIPDALRAQGLRFALIAAVQKKPAITLDGAPARLSFPAAMLAPRPALYAEIPASEAAPQPEAAPIPALLASLSSPALRRTLGLDPLAAPTLAQAPAAITHCAGMQLCAAAVEPGGDLFAAVRDCALTLIARLTAAGAPFSAITLALSAALPTSTRRDNGRAIAALLGLHTVQVELGIPAAPASLTAGDTLRVTVAAYAPASPETAPALSADLPLWLLAPRSTAPHLDGERALLQLAANARTAGHAIIATGMLAPSAAAAQATVDAGLCLTLTAPADALNQPLPCGMLIAAPEMPALPDGVAAIELGRTRAWAANAVTCGDAATPMQQYLAALRGDLPAPILPAADTAQPPRISSRRCPRPRVLIPYADIAPTALAATITTLGGEPVLCAIDLSSAAAARHSISAYADLLDSAQILLLSGSRAFAAALLSQRRAVDALAALRSRDGLICAWSGVFAALLSFGYFSPEGKPITAAPLTGERILSSALTSTATPWVGDLPLGWRETTLLNTAPLCPILPPRPAKPSPPPAASSPAPPVPLTAPPPSPPSPPPTAPCSDLPHRPLSLF